jgi:hypothetical protein
LYGVPPQAGPPQQGYQVVLGVVAVGAALQPASPTGMPGAWRFFDKQGLFIRARSPTVIISVAEGWRTRVAVAWGNVSAPVSAIRATRCSQPTSGWHGYPGGYYLKTPTPRCVPLVVRIKQRSATVRVGIGRSCS